MTEKKTPGKMSFENTKSGAGNKHKHKHNNDNNDNNDNTYHYYHDCHYYCYHPESRAGATPRARRCSTPSLPTKSLGFEGFDSSRL